MARAPELVYNPRVRCSRHPGEIAAVCRDCYDAALQQQKWQRQEEQREAHREYLLRTIADGN